MVSKSQKKLIRSLKTKKNRKEHQLFAAEGIKVIQEFLETDLELKYIFVLASEIKSFSISDSSKVNEVSATELEQLSFLTTPQKAIAVFEIPKTETISIPKKSLQLMLDGISDPGNLGTIIRLCDWFGIETLICSPTTVDCYNPKVVQATMGSLTRVKIIYTNLREYIKNSNAIVYGTFMDGDNIYKNTFSSKNKPTTCNEIIIMGNEANGISPEIESLVSKRISIPRFGTIQKTESLNVATATAIVLSEFKRKG